MLGPLEVRSGDRLLELGRPKQRALLALLLLRANRVVPRDRLIDELWPNEPPETAVKAVQVYVSQLRKVLPGGTLVTRAPGYLLAVDPEAVDLLAFERLVADARGVDPARAAALLREALALWHGAPLAEFGDELFLRVEANRLAEMRLAAVEERIDADLALGRGRELIAELEALVAEQPHRERLRAQLMRALYRSGRQADALGAYRDAQAALRELGLEPGPELRELERQVLTQNPALDRPRAEPVAESRILPGSLIPAPPFPFVGRSAELKLLRSALERAQDGEGALVLLAGEAGAGKTRLIREFAHEAASRGVLVLYGTSDAAVTTPYQPLREWIEFLLHACPPETLQSCLPSRSEDLTRLVPELARLTGPPADRTEVDSDRYVLQSAASQLLRRLSAQQPLLLIADDLHWADDETLSLLQRLARAAPEGRMLALAAFRDHGEELRPAFHDTLTDLSRLDGVVRVGLGNLTVEDVGAFVQRSTGAEASPDLAAAIGELSDGTPLLLCELWRDLQESGAVEVSEAGVRVSRPLAELRGAGRLRDVVQQRVARLTPETATALDLAAVAGPRFELRVIAAAAALDSDALIAALDEAAGAGLLEELPERSPACRFTHELVRRAIYDRIRPIRRAELHLRIGEALERVHERDVSRVLPDLAHHFSLAVPVAGSDRAVDYNLRAGDAAIGTAAFDEAAARLSSALELGIDDPRERTRVQIELGHVFNELGRHSESYAILAESLDAATGLGERGLAARALVQRTSQRMFSNPDSDPAEIFRVADAAIATFTELDDALGLAVATRLRSLAFKRVGREGDATVEAERALVYAEASGHHVTRRRVVGTLVYALTEGPTPAPEGIERCQQLLQRFPDDPVLRALVGRALAALLAMAGRFDEAREQAGRSVPLLDELKHLTASGVYRTIAAEARELLGDFAGAEEELTAMWRDLRDASGQTPDGRAMAAAYKLASLYCDGARWTDAAEWLAYAQHVPDATHPTHALVFRLIVSARLAAHDGRLREAVTLAQRAVELEDHSHRLNLRAKVWLTLAEVQRAAGSAAEAHAAVAEAGRLYEAKGNVAGRRLAERWTATGTARSRR